MEKIKDLWGRYPRQIYDIIALLSALSILAWIFSEPLSGLVDVGIFSRYPSVLRLTVALVLVSIGYIVFDLAYFFSKRGAAALLVKDASACMRENLLRTDCSEVRVFSSGGEDAKNRFLELTQESFMPQKEVKIRVLLRGDQTPQRDVVLQVLVDRWRRDIDGVTSRRGCGYKFVTEFSVYQSPVMLRGYVFDSSVAALSWYARDTVVTSSPNMPHMLIRSVSKHGDDFIGQAIYTFDHFFGLGRKL